jgi:cyanophycinase-like exopeptidase
MPQDTRPIYLFADSQLLFWKSGGKLLLEGLAAGGAGPAAGAASLGAAATIPAAYIGASNGDAPEFYSIFEGAMDAVGITERRMIRAAYDADDREFLERAQLIVLAGGDVQRGWNSFQTTGMKQAILARYAQGAVLVGVSAGAVQLGRRAIAETEDSSALELLDVFNLVPAIIDVHDEHREWSRLSRTVHMLEGEITGLGIPSGGGLIVHPDGTFEALRRPVDEFSWDGSQIKHSILLPEAAE